ncbi:unnamed protein product [Strongylus vulgaris]|uniref:Histidine acid phosphatase n=1 Tax=Strongylus vulgaris TaxID=40348 RepID=A0A3P7M0Z2_STRVU|nr:unnamed protein product [Strongylus vulgaris]
MYVNNIYRASLCHTYLRKISGPLLKDIVDRFIAKRNGALGEKPKLYAYSAHDTTLAAMLSTLGIYPEDFPKYATAVLMELHKKEGEFIVEVNSIIGIKIVDG